MMKGVFGTGSGLGLLGEEIRGKVLEMKTGERSLDVQRVLEQVLGKFGSE